MNYIRFGKIPENGKSEIWKGDVFNGHEKGVSVYESYNEKVVMPKKITYSSCVSLSGCLDRNIYLVTGKRIGTGSDGEPLLKNVSIIKQL